MPKQTRSKRERKRGHGGYGNTLYRGLILLWVDPALLSKAIENTRAHDQAQQKACTVLLYSERTVDALRYVIL
jgi:hypothetical protein